MNELPARILDAHGGMDRWNSYQKVGATIVTGGGFFALKGVLQDANPRRMTVWLHEERSSVVPYGAPDLRTMFSPDRIAIEKLDGTLVAERAQGHLRRPSDEHAMGVPDAVRTHSSERGGGVVAWPPAIGVRLGRCLTVQV